MREASSHGSSFCKLATKVLEDGKPKFVDYAPKVDHDDPKTDMSEMNRLIPTGIPPRQDPNACPPFRQMRMADYEFE